MAAVPTTQYPLASTTALTIQADWPDVVVTLVPCSASDWH
jgi:hypothetical protein